MLQRGADNIQIDDEQQSHFLACWVMIGCLHKTSPKRKKNLWGKGKKNEGAQTVIVHDLCRWRNRCCSARWPTTNGMSVRECVCVRCEGEWGVLSCVVMKEKTNILHHVPYHTFPHWLGLFKSCCQPCLSASLSLCLGLWELLSTVWRRQTAFPLKFGSPSGELSRPDLQCDMLLCINVLVLLLLQLALSSPVPLTTPSRGCPTCKPKLMQTQASEVLNATAPGVGGQCGVYTLSCALGLRCTPPPGEPRPLRALLEGRGVCSNASSISPTVNPNLAGKGFLLRVGMRKDFRHTCELKSFELVTVQWFRHPWNNDDDDEMMITAADVCQ